MAEIRLYQVILVVALDDQFPEILVENLARMTQSGSWWGSVDRLRLDVVPLHLQAGDVPRIPRSRPPPPCERSPQRHPRHQVLQHVAQSLARWTSESCG